MMKDSVDADSAPSSRNIKKITAGGVNYTIAEVPPNMAAKSRAMKKLYVKAFPPYERDSWKCFLKYNKKYYYGKHLEADKNNNGEIIWRYTVLYCIFRENIHPQNIIGFLNMSYIPDSKLYYLEYLAVHPQYRNKGLGTELLNIGIGDFMKIMCKSPDIPKVAEIVGEIESFEKGGKPNDDRIIRRRIEFYIRNGFGILDVDYYCPERKYFLPFIYPKKDFLIIKYSNGDLPRFLKRNRVIEIIRGIYKYVYELGDRRIDKFICYVKRKRGRFFPPESRQYIDVITNPFELQRRMG